MSENTAVAEAPVEAKPVKEPKVATACACSEFATTLAGIKTNTGCTALTVNTFGPGHDAKLKSLLIKAAVAGEAVIKTGLDGSFEELTALDAANLHGFGDQVKKSADARLLKLTVSGEKKAAAAEKKAEGEAKKAAAKEARETAAAAKKAEREAVKAAAAEKKAADKAAKEQAALEAKAAQEAANAAAEATPAE